MSILIFMHQCIPVKPWESSCLNKFEDKDIILVLKYLHITLFISISFNFVTVNLNPFVQICMSIDYDIAFFLKRFFASGNWNIFLWFDVILKVRIRFCLFFVRLSLQITISISIMMADYHKKHPIVNMWNEIFEWMKRRKILLL